MFTYIVEFKIRKILAPFLHAYKYRIAKHKNTIKHISMWTSFPGNCEPFASKVTSLALLFCLISFTARCSLLKVTEANTNIHKIFYAAHIHLARIFHEIRHEYVMWRLGHKFSICIYYMPVPVSSFINIFWL